MLIDINANVGHWPFRKMRHNTCEALSERMDKFGVDVSVISNMNGIFYKDTQAANRELFNEIQEKKRFKNRFVPFAIINPIYAGWQNDFKESISKLGMKGIRVYPKYHDYEVADPKLVELVKMARDAGVPVAFTMRMVDSRQRSWMDIDYVAYTAKPEWSLKSIMPIIRAVPDAKFMILNASNSIYLDGEDAAVFAKADVLIDTSGRTLVDLGGLLKIQGKERFAFGTHSPIFDYLTGQLRIESLRPEEADEKTKELLRSGNAKRFLGL